MTGMSKTVLIIDDSPSVRQLVNITLAPVGYSVVEACDGKDALSKLNGNKIHLIICDINMPNMDGLTFVNEIKKLPAHKFIPIIMLTSHSGEKEKQAGRAAGVKVWMVKPFAPDQLTDLVSRFVMH